MLLSDTLHFCFGCLWFRLVFNSFVGPKQRPCQGRGGGGPMSLVWILKHFMSMFVNASRCCRELNKNSLSLLNFRKEGIALQRNHYSSAISQLTVRIWNTYTLLFTIKTVIHVQHFWRLKYYNWPRKIDENYFFLAFRLVENWPNHRSFFLILGFAVTVAIWPREVVLVTISFYALSLLFGPCGLLEFTMVRPHNNIVRYRSLVLYV